MVDDDVVNTVEGENSLKSRLKKMGVEIVLFDESNVTQGDIIFYDSEQTYQHVLVADHMDEQGNWRVFGNSSSANKIMEQPLYQGQTPAWIAKVSTLNGAMNVQTQRKEKLRRRSRPSRSSTSTRKIRRRKNFWNSSPRKDFLKPSTTPTSNPSIFFNGMFDDKDKFQNTPENRNAIITRYGDEFKTWTANQNQQTQKPQQDNSFDNGFSLKQAVNLIS